MSTIVATMQQQNILINIEWEQSNGIEFVITYMPSRITNNKIVYSFFIKGFKYLVLT